MGEKSNPPRNHLHLSALALLCLGSLCLAYFAPSNTQKLEAPAAPHPQRPSEEADTAAPLAQDPKLLQAPLAQIRTTFESGDSFRIHYHALLLTQELPPASIETLLRHTTDLKGFDANILGLIFGLDLAFRDPDRLARLLSDSKFRSKSPLRIDALYSYWAQGRPQAALESAIKLTQPARNIALSGIYRSGIPEIAKQADAHLNQASPNTAPDSPSLARESLQDAIASKEWEQDREAFIQSFRAAYSTDPLSGIKEALKIDDPVTSQRLLDELSNTRWANPIEDLKSLLQLVTPETVPSAERRRNILSKLFRNIEESDYPTALDILHQGLTPEERNFVYPQLASRTSSPLALLQSDFFKSLPNSPQKQNFLQSALLQYARTDWASSFELASEILPPHVTDKLIPQLIGQAFQNDGSEAALQLLQATSNQQSRSQAINTLSHTWGRTAPMDFIAWTQSQPDQHNFREIQKQTARNWARQDLATLLDFVDQIGESPLKQSLQSGIAHHYVQTDPLRAIEYASKLQNIDEAAPIISQSAASLAQTNPTLALELLYSTFPDHPTTTNGLQQIAYHWANKDPEEAAIYFSSLENETHSQAGLHPVLETWVQYDYEKAIGFIKEIPASNARDAFLSRIGVSLRYSRNDLQAAAEIISLISDETLRNNTKLRIESAQPWQW
ncbi:hypothetical protein [Pelagicoccus sp. SDUM812005]|uniref:hypothetical protein n=1 Tax=Pelagicoccus sp. SDUM812005 TaxID=3041257 RepID=UPI00280C6682|nr:hypothetical protein [Pelagicoccus sp. SDUM812005]MDQ8183011.1 hypothetical protein [Pelagicoccus sp. SDUM812005]